MKTFLAVGVWLMAAVVSVQAQGNRADPPQPRVTERGLHHRVWETVIWQEDMFGETRPQTHRFTELATGMHTVRNGEFVPASDELEITATGARASKALHGVEIQGASCHLLSAQILRNRLGWGASFHLRAPLADGQAHFLLQNTYLNTNGTAVNLFPEPLALPVHFVP